MTSGGPESAEQGAVSSAEMDEDELVAWGRELGMAAARSGPFVALVGPLGSGKSTLVRAACRGAGVRGRVPSPTYTLIHEYPLSGGGRLFHVDLYRIGDPAELRDIGWARVLAAEGPVFVEWADRVRERLPADRWEIRLEMARGGESRRVEARRVGDAPELPLPGGGRLQEEPSAGDGGLSGGPDATNRESPRPVVEDRVSPEGDGC